MIYQLNAVGLDSKKGSHLEDIIANGAHPTAGMYHVRVATQVTSVGDSVQAQVKLRVADLNGTVREVLDYLTDFSSVELPDVRDVLVMYGGNDQTFELEITDVDGTPGNESVYGLGFHID